jgi:O-antigen ligase
MIISKLPKINFSLLILSLLPIAFVAGPLLVEIIINIIILIFLYTCIKNKDYRFFKNKIFIFFFIFYVYLIINLIYSDFFKETALNVFSYIRFILFPFAVCQVLEKNDKNLKFVFIIFSFSIFIVVIDGYYQFIYGKNFLGFEKYRLDRISGFFKDDLILGSFLSRLLPLFMALIIFFKKNLKITVLNLLIFFSTFILIFLTGERASFIMASLTLLIIMISIKSYFYLRIILFSILVSTIAVLINSNSTLFDRHYNQLKVHIFSKQDNANIILPYYLPMFKTSFKMFDDSKLIGHGPKSYRYLCNDKKFTTYFPKPITIDNTVIKLPNNWKELNNIEIIDFFVQEGDIIAVGDKILTYQYIGSKNIQSFFSKKEGKVNKIFNQKDRYISNDIVFKITPQHSVNHLLKFKNACNTHPHNFYIQLLAETGLIGFIFIFSLFIYLLLHIVKNIFFKYFNDSEICILIGFFVVLWPLTTNGNFFNNWINLISFYPLGFLLYMLNIKNKER